MCPESEQPLHRNEPHADYEYISEVSQPTLEEDDEATKKFVRMLNASGG